MITALRDDTGNLRGFTKITRDLTEKRNAELYAKQLHEIELALNKANERAKEFWFHREQLRVTLHTIGDGVIATDEHGLVTLLNPVAQALTGWSDKEALDLTLDSVVRVVDEVTRQPIENLAVQAIRADSTVRLVNPAILISRDGKQHSTTVTAAPIRGDNNQILGVVVVFRDFTKRLKERAIEAVSQGILITDCKQIDNPIIYASTGFERITGYHAEEVLGKNCRFLQGPETAPEQVQIMREAICSGEECSVELLNYRKDGSKFWNSLVLTPLRDDEGELLHFVGVQTDITERRILEQSLLQSQKMESVGKLAGGIAHDFNNLLTIILGDCEFLEQDTTMSLVSHQLNQEIYAVATKAAMLTEQLLAFSRKQILQPNVLDLNKIIENIGKMLGRLIGEDVKLKTYLAPQLWLVRLDVGQFEQVLINLAVNARDAMPRGGTLRIETSNLHIDETQSQMHPGVVPGSYVLITMSDSGHGMDEETLARIFEPFFTTKTLGEGTGLGLATVFGIIKQSEGHIAASSTLGQGATFRIYIPKVDASIVDFVEKSHQSQKVHGHETILVVEDEAAVRQLVCRILRSYDYTVIESASPSEAIQIFDKHQGQIDLVITDVVMPEMNGQQLTEKLREMNPRIDILFVSGYTDDTVVRHGVYEADTNFIQKPFSREAIATKIREILDNPDKQS